MGTTEDLLHQIFRSSPRYQLLKFGELSAEARAAVADLARAKDAYGVLRPRVAPLGTKSASRAVAALVRSLRTPRRLPAALRRLPDMPLEIARLVLDGILEVRRDGRFVSGAAAWQLLPEAPIRMATDRIASLSIAAVRYGESLPIYDPSQLSARMYFYNRLPVTPRWARRLPSSAATADFLGVTKQGELARLLRRHWRASTEAPQAWFVWSPRQPSRDAVDRPTHKLYVSPECSALPEVLRLVVGTLAETRPAHFKVGCDVHGLLRPDKLVLYFESREHLEELRAALDGKLEGIEAHGIPFTEPLTPDGLLSAGVDPPRGTKVLSWHETESWRLWTTNRLAVYMLTARATSSPQAIAPADFAIARLRLEGVDTTTWSPTTTLWSSYLPGNGA